MRTERRSVGWLCFWLPRRSRQLVGVLCHPDQLATGGHSELTDGDRYMTDGQTSPHAPPGPVWRRPDAIPGKLALGMLSMDRLVGRFNGIIHPRVLAGGLPPTRDMSAKRNAMKAEV